MASHFCSSRLRRCVLGNRGTEKSETATQNTACQYAAVGKGPLMLRSLRTLPVTILLLASASNAATAARVCIGGHFHYGGSGLHHDRVHAQASAVRAWRAIQAESHDGKGCRQYVSGQQSDSLQTRPSQRGLALFRPWWSVPYRLKLIMERVIGRNEASSDP